MRTEGVCDEVELVDVVPPREQRLAVDELGKDAAGRPAPAPHVPLRGSGRGGGGGTSRTPLTGAHAAHLTGSKQKMGGGNSLRGARVPVLCQSGGKRLTMLNPS